MAISVENLESEMQIAASMARFDDPLDANAIRFLKTHGYRDGETRTTGCLGWIWYQWLSGKRTSGIEQEVSQFVERGIQMRTMSDVFSSRPLHDLLVLSAACMTSSNTQLRRAAESCVDADGSGDHAPQNNGELYESAWAGMLKFRILGDVEESARQGAIANQAYRHPSIATAPRPLVNAWLKRDWKLFAERQQKDFLRLWKKAKKDGAVSLTSESRPVVDISVLGATKQMWCWAHAAMAMLAFREGAQVETDEFWFPAAALK